MTGGGEGPAYRLLGTPRFLLALLVVVWHALPIADMNEAWLLDSDFGPTAVFVFFTLSGFIVAEAALAYYAGRPVAFFANRLLRLWPGYLIALAAMAILLWAGGEARPALLTPANLAANALALFPSVVITDPLLGLDHRAELLPIVWALRVEFVFYLLVAVALAAGRLGARGIWLVVALWLLLAGNLVFHHLWDGSPRATFYFGMAPYFVVGVAWALSLHGRLDRATAVPMLALSVLLSLLHALSFTAFDADAPAWQRPLTSGAFVSAGLWFLFVLWCWRRLGLPASGSRLASDRLLGGLTYELYLVHLPVIVLVALIWPAPDWASLPLILALSVAVAAVLSAFLAATLRPLRRRLRGQALPSGR